MIYLLTRYFLVTRRSQFPVSARDQLCWLTFVSFFSDFAENCQNPIQNRPRLPPSTPVSIYHLQLPVSGRSWIQINIASGVRLSWLRFFVLNLPCLQAIAVYRRSAGRLVVLTRACKHSVFAGRDLSCFLPPTRGLNPPIFMTPFYVNNNNNGWEITENVRRI
jgi:hypothetical protein